MPSLKTRWFPRAGAVNLVSELKRAQKSFSLAARSKWSTSLEVVRFVLEFIGHEASVLTSCYGGGLVSLSFDVNFLRISTSSSDEVLEIGSW